MRFKRQNIIANAPEIDHAGKDVRLMQMGDIKIGIESLIDWLRSKMSIRRRFTNTLLKGVIVQCAVLMVRSPSTTDTIIVSVVKMKAINLDKGRNIFFSLF